MIGALSGLLIGGAYGYVAHRGAFCMNSGFRVLVTKRDMTQLKAYALAVAVQMIGLPLLFLAGASEPTYPPLFPLGAVVGGLLFGASMHRAGGCAAGVWYKAGAGSLDTLPAIAGMALGAAAFEVGPFAGFRAALQSIGSGSMEPLPKLLWAVTPVAGFVLLGLLYRASPGTAGSWSWRRTGLIMGLIGVAAWAASGLGGREFGMAVIPGTVGLVTDPLTKFVTWDSLFVIGLPAGTYVAARLQGPVGLTRVLPTKALSRFVGGLGLGAGASLAAGCTVGHGLTGVPLLAPGSIVTIVSIFAGSALIALWSQHREARMSISLP